MVAHFVRLKLTLMANAFRRSVWQTIGFVVGALYGLGIVGLLVSAMIALGSTDVALAGTVLILAGTVVTLGWWIVPLLAFGVDSTLDPQRFVLFPIARRRLLAGLASAGLIGIPGTVTAVTVLGASLGFWRNHAALAAALVGGMVAVAACVVGSRAWTTALAPLLGSRRYRGVATVAAFVPIMLLGPAISWFGRQMSEPGGDATARQTAAQLAAIAGWTPLGAPWGLPDAVVSGAWAVAAARLAIALASLAVVWWVWDRALAKALVTPPAAGSAGRAKGLGWFGRLPATPMGAVTARAATYWVRDPRYAASIAIIPLIPVVLLAMGRGTSPKAFLIFAPAVAWLLGFSLSADLAYDYTAFALHVSTGVTGRADRWGRALLVLAAGVPVTIMFAVVSVWVSGEWSLLPTIAGASIGILFTGLGVSSVASARVIYPVAKPGDNPFKTPRGNTMATMIAQLATMAILVALSLPVVILLAIAIFGHAGWVAWAVLVVGPALGFVFLRLGIHLGARAYDRSAPELLAKLAAFA